MSRGYKVGNYIKRNEQISLRESLILMKGKTLIPLKIYLTTFPDIYKWVTFKTSKDSPHFTHSYKWVNTSIYRQSLERQVVIKGQD